MSQALLRSIIHPLDEEASKRLRVLHKKIVERKRCCGGLPGYFSFGFGLIFIDLEIIGQLSKGIMDGRVEIYKASNSSSASQLQSPLKRCSSIVFDPGIEEIFLRRTFGQGRWDGSLTLRSTLVR